MDDKKEFYIDFSGYISITAKNTEEAENTEDESWK